MEHIRNEDFERYDVQKIEAVAHGIEVPVTEETTEDEISAKIAEILERLQKRRKKIERKLKMYQKKYAGMSIYEIMQHNDKMLEKYDR